MSQCVGEGREGKGREATPSVHPGGTKLLISVLAAGLQPGWMGQEGGAGQKRTAMTEEEGEVGVYLLSKIVLKGHERRKTEIRREDAEGRKFIAWLNPPPPPSPPPPTTTAL